jgi:tRNA threonylcarbamoyladenosine biosynthesis protein TsaB
MNVLALDTATAATVAGVLAGTRVREERDDPPAGARPRHAERALELAEAALAAAGLGWAELDRLAVGVGPGGFTGLRIGVATARALAQAHGKPLVAVSTLRALAVGAGADGDVAAVVDARRGEVFAAAWDGLGRELLAPAALAPAALAELLATAEAPLTCVGDGALRYRDVLAPVARVPAHGHEVRAAALCRLAEEAEPAPLEAILPCYVRDPDAKPPRSPA